MNGPKILIVDDEEQIRELVKSRLQSAGNFVIYSAEDGKTGVKAAFETHPDLILLDVMMPVMDGPSAAVLLRSDERTRNTPIIFLTNLVEKGETQRGSHRIGNNCFMAKSLLSQDLLPLVKRTLRFDPPTKIY